jgi:hypothetical protein
MGARAPKKNQIDVNFRPGAPKAFKVSNAAIAAVEAAG